MYYKTYLYPYNLKLGSTIDPMFFRHRALPGASQAGRHKIWRFGPEKVRRGGAPKDRKVSIGQNPGT